VRVHWRGDSRDGLGTEGRNHRTEIAILAKNRKFFFEFLRKVQIKCLGRMNRKDPDAFIPTTKTDRPRTRAAGDATGGQRP